jgi:hypothetical protein
MLNSSLPSAIPSATPEPTPIVSGYDRPVAVMIDNERPARPQAGLDKAYAIYEIIVEGGESRFMALFKGAKVDKLGPVRSSRHYFLDYMMEHDAIYTHYGWSPQAQADIKKAGINNINGVTGDGSIFWREKGKRGDYHNAFTSMDNILKLAAQKGYRTKTSEEAVFKYNLEGNVPLTGENATTIKIPYSFRHTTDYTYNAEQKVYKRVMDGTPHTDRFTKQQYSAKNIIIQFVKNYNLNDGTKAGRQGLYDTGNGNGYFIANGKYIPITWENKSWASKTIYKDMEDNEIVLNNGNVWIQVVPLGNKVTIK